MHSSKAGFISQISALARYANHNALVEVFLEASEYYAVDLDFQNEMGSLVLQYGYVSLAQSCYERVLQIQPDNFIALLNLSNIFHSIGQNLTSLQLINRLLEKNPQHPILRRNVLLIQEYEHTCSDLKRFVDAKNWGEWAIKQAGGLHNRPPMKARNNRKLRIGYVSADFCQHTVGLFIKDLLSQHQTDKFDIYTYSNTQQIDWVTELIKKNSHYQVIQHLDNAAVAAQIERDQIDVLIDLSGHTAGSRLSVFTLRPAPVMISWLGYFATTGLSYIDAIFLDHFHYTKLNCDYFTEKIFFIDPCRFCYQPVAWARDTPLTQLPALTNGFITFASFNNTAKLNENVLNLWAKILLAVPNSKLVLKWRTFIDVNFSDSIREFFIQQGIPSARLDLQAASFHQDLFKAYSQIDIALDPFPFSGGLTSCEALWMGLPVITWPQNRIVSRQTYSFLSTIGLTETVASNETEYIQFAVNLANNLSHLAKIRQTLRQTMLKSKLLDIASFTQQIEQLYIQVFDEIFAKSG